MLAPRFAGPCQSPVFLGSGLAAFAAHLAWQIIRIDIDDPDSCLRMFRANRDAGALIASADEAMYREKSGV